MQKGCRSPLHEDMGVCICDLNICVSQQDDLYKMTVL